MFPSRHQISIAVRDYDLAATLTSGQAFRWRKRDQGWEGIIGRRWIRITPADQDWTAETAATMDPSATSVSRDWSWLTHYLQLEINLGSILATFPDDPPLRASVAACRGLRLLRQDPWECLASFICSSTKQIVQIQQIIEHLCERFGEAVPMPAATTDGVGPGGNQRWAFAFPTSERLARATDAELRACKMGFRAPYVLAAAQAVAQGRLDLERLRQIGYAEALATLTALPGVGEKIANCVLLFAYGYSEAFPVDVWVMKALRQLYFPRRKPTPERLRKFVGTYFGPNAGYAQQYLFHYMRLHAREAQTAQSAAL